MSTTPNSVPLPTTLAEAFELALTEFQSVLDLPHVKINMNDWYVKYRQGTCFVCLAGSILLNHKAQFESGLRQPTYDQPSLKDYVELWSTTDPHEGLEQWQNVFEAINSLRFGYIEKAFSELHSTVGSIKLSIPPEISENPLFDKTFSMEQLPEWLTFWNTILDYLKEHNL